MLTLDKIELNISILEVELTQLRQVHWQYKSGNKTEEDLRIAYNEFKSNISWEVINGRD